jgi:hypothetical protein
VQTGPITAGPGVTVGETSPPAPTPTSTGPPAPTATSGVLGAPGGGPAATTSGTAGPGPTVSRASRSAEQQGRPGINRTFGANRELGRSRVVSQLPFTGLALWLLFALGLALLTSGAGARSYAHAR